MPDEDVEKKNLLVEDHGNLVFYIDKVHMTSILERDYKTEDIIVVKVISESEENSDGKQKHYKRNKENEKKLPTY